MMHSTDKLLLENKAWAQEMITDDPEYFSRLSDIQTPEFLWIGCSDSRVPANQITGTQPGEIFVHRNIANMVVHTDLNLLSVLEYAVVYLKVKHVIVCGHYGCGGVKAAMDSHSYGMINKWLRNIKDVYRYHRDELAGIEDQEQRTNRLVELNVMEQVMNLAKTSIIQKAWSEEQRPDLHGWVYGLHDGLIKTVYDMPAGTHLDPLYEFDNLKQ
ncbi:MAG: carbonate dehydratase [Chitinophagales bacterium]|nr:carbonate dehydratase [Chitinophagales bacterium]HQU76582.1 carbonate dehydratase [Chitinophagales bacterium]HRX24846.1 carbonate dehydratase [Chitinophagales bacterium]